jgi:hypothetical protein
MENNEVNRTDLVKNDGSHQFRRTAGAGRGEYYRGFNPSDKESIENALIYVGATESEQSYWLKSFGFE